MDDLEERIISDDSKKDAHYEIKERKESYVMIYHLPYGTYEVLSNLYQETEEIISKLSQEKRVEVHLQWGERREFSDVMDVVCAMLIRHPNVSVKLDEKERMKIERKGLMGALEHLGDGVYQLARK